MSAFKNKTKQNKKQVVWQPWVCMELVVLGSQFQKVGA